MLAILFASLFFLVLENVLVDIDIPVTRRASNSGVDTIRKFSNKI
jgi:hypothetical protein